MKNLGFAGLVFMLLIGFGSCKNSKRASKTHAKTSSRVETSSATSSNLIQKKYASILEVPVGEIKNIALYKFVDEWIGTPYSYGGFTTSGADCSGFTGALYSEVYKKSIPRTTTEIEKQTKSVEKSSLKEGDVVIFDIEGKKNSHVGVYLLNGRFVHASTSKGVIISTLDSPYYQRCFNRGGRF